MHMHFHVNACTCVRDGVQDGGGTISKAELADLMHTLGIRASSEEIELMVKEVDVDGVRTLHCVARMCVALARGERCILHALRTATSQCCATTFCSQERLNFRSSCSYVCSARTHTCSMCVVTVGCAPGTSLIVCVCEDECAGDATASVRVVLQARRVGSIQAV